MAGISKPNAGNLENLPARLIICCDGTGDTANGSFSAFSGSIRGSKDSIKSIFDMVKAGVVEDSAGKKTFQHAEYIEGIGTDGVAEGGPGLFVRAEALFEGATGYGYLEIFKKAYKACCKNLQHGDENEIFLFGFSRGAFIVRALASFLQHVGLINEEYLDNDERFEAKFYELLRRYCELTKKIKLPMQVSISLHHSADLLPFCKPSPRVRLVGAFDTVKTVIPLPGHNLLFHGIPNIDFEIDAPRIVDHFRHALALNEARSLFSPDLWKSDKNSDDSSYLEAWFFGHHHDIGGGGDHQGLALWPLQWILHAAMDYGLIIDQTIEPYDVLFSGVGNTIDTPHDIAMKMFDMIRHHGTTKAFGLQLNKPSSILPPEPRNYFEYLTTPPYLKFFKPKVFLHPSAYLIFDISSAFRIQVYDWKFFRNFLRDRFLAIPRSVAPWWERQTVESILKESSAVEHLNILVYGRPGTGKANLINRMFGEGFIGESKTPLTDNKVKSHDINTPVSIPGNNNVRVHYSDGFGKDGTDSPESVAKFLAEHGKNADVKDQIHAMWYFLDCAEGEIEKSEEEFFKMNFGDIPIIVILKNEDKLGDIIRGDMTDVKLPDELTIQKLIEETIEKKKAQLAGFPVRSFVRSVNALDTAKDLLTESSVSYNNEAVQIAQIKAQRVVVKPKIALATEESIRAYTIWHCFKFNGQKIAFGRNKGDEKLKLSSMLMEPVLATFNMRFPGDEALIYSKIGAAWGALDKHTSGLWDTTLPGSLVLMCMLDVILVLAHAVSHQKIGLKLKLITDTARPLTAADVEQACAWYTNPKDDRQKATHTTIKSLLSESDWSPNDGSMANLQMRVIETIEIESGSAENASPIGVLGGVVGGVVQGALAGGRKALFGK